MRAPTRLRPAPSEPLRAPLCRPRGREEGGAVGRHLRLGDGRRRRRLHRGAIRRDGRQEGSHGAPRPPCPLPSPPPPPTTPPRGLTHRRCRRSARWAASSPRSRCTRRSRPTSSSPSSPQAEGSGDTRGVARRRWGPAERGARERASACQHAVCVIHAHSCFRSRVDVKGERLETPDHTPPIHIPTRLTLVKRARMQTACDV